MKIRSVEFMKGVTGEEDALDDGIPQVAFIGRSNVGKSSVINSLVNRRDLAHSSSTAGRTRQINMYLVNKDFYLVDLPGYGYATGSKQERQNLRNLIYWYLLFSNIQHAKVVLIVDANVGVTDYDLEMLRRLEEKDKDILIVANKVDKIKKTNYTKQLQQLQEKVGKHIIIPYSAEKKIGVSQLADALVQ